MKTNIFSRTILLSMIAIVSFTMLTSFTDHSNLKHNDACVISCNFSPTTSGFAAAAFDNCNGAQTHGAIAAGASWMPILNHNGCGVSMVGISITITGTHAAGTVRILKNGTQIFSHAVAANAGYSFDMGFSAFCSDGFVVTW